MNNTNLDSSNVTVNQPKKVLVLGSGPIIIGQAAEFDYAGTQACRSLREEGIFTILVNSNPATIMTDEDIADVVYIEPLTVEVVSRIIEQERPDSLLATLGGQTGLNLAVALSDAGVLSKYNVRVLGTPLEGIRKAEDRELFKNLLTEIGEPVIEGFIANTFAEAKTAAETIGLPIIVRPAYTLGGTGGGIAYNWQQFDVFAESGLHASPISQILVEKYLGGWKEVEYEVMRDGADNCITICNMENLDPLGVHTGDSMVVAPSQTLSDKEYQMLRSASLKIIRALGIEGGCNVQYALDPHSFQYYVIEVNPRVSRSSALASKATGYPIARVAAKIAIGKHLDEIPNAVTRQTKAAFEPTLDYVVVKLARFPFDKFPTGDRTIGTQMKATGEVMAIDRTFEAALQKAVRSLEWGGKTLRWEERDWNTPRTIDEQLKEIFPLVEKANDRRLWAVFAALRRGVTAEVIYEKSRIDIWFLRKFQRLIAMEQRLLRTKQLNPELLYEAKRLGFSDEVIGDLTEENLMERVRARRHEYGILPVYKMVDTCAAEFEAVTPYFYSTYEDENEAEPLPGKRGVVIGSGPIRIGQGVEFDYSCVHAAWALQQAGYQSIIINSNPETVSTDFDTSNRLYFEALDEESVLDVLENEGLPGANGSIELPPVILQFGGQTAINLAEPLSKKNIAILGSGADTIDIAEDRKRFENFISRLGIMQPPGATVMQVEDAFRVAERIGYPVLVRPSYVLGGRAMEICQNENDLRNYVNTVTRVSEKHPVLVDKYFQGKEVEVDAICDGEQVLIPGVMEHIERAGVHSGDSFAVYPGVNLKSHEVDTIVEYTTRVGIGMKAKGLINIQFVIYQGRVYIIEVNPRASRTVPFLSKVTGVPMVKLAVGIMLGNLLAQQGYAGGLYPRQDLVAVKAPVFSMSKLSGVDTYLGPEMKSTGEVMGIDKTYEAAMQKALIAAKMALPPEGTIFFSIADRDKEDAIAPIQQLAKLGYEFAATEGTASLIESYSIPVKIIARKMDEGSPNTLDLIRQGQVQAVVNTISGRRRPMLDGFEIRRAAVENGIPCYTSLDTVRAAVEALAGGNVFYNVKPLPWYRQRA